LVETLGLDRAPTFSRTTTALGFRSKTMARDEVVL
jgi:hypothetical protein